MILFMVAVPVSRSVATVQSVIAPYCENVLLRESVVVSHPVDRRIHTEQNSIGKAKHQWLCLLIQRQLHKPKESVARCTVLAP
jgi:hypothetical protein